MVKKKNIRENREKIYNFDSDKELCIYKNLCITKKLKKADIKKIGDCNFNTYAQWNTYVRKKYAPAPLRSLQEFRHYLINRRRCCGIVNNWWNIFLVPFFIMVIGTFAFEALKEIMNFNVFGMEEIVQLILSVDFIEKISIILVIVMIVIIALSPIILGLWKFMLNTMGITMENELEKAFYDDYIEIIESLIGEKGN